MKNDSETVREVCAEIREYCDGRRQPYDTVMQTCANRIERVYDSEIASKNEEIARLKAALKPVMECDLNKAFSLGIAMFSVREAQRIMKEGEAK